jgi:hypothetical protein
MSSITAGHTWSDTADQLAAFHATHGRFPSQIATDPDEKRLGSWLSTQRANARTGKATLTPERRAYLEGVLPVWLSKQRAQGDPRG